MPPFQFRPTTPADEPAIAAFLRESFAMAPDHPGIAPRNLAWKYWEECEGWPGSRSYVLTKEGEVMAHGAVAPGVWLAGQRRIKVAHVIDWAAKPGFGGSGVALMKRLGQMTDVLVAVDGTEVTLQILPVIGFKQYGTVHRFVRPVRPLARLRHASEMTWRLLPQFARSVLWAATAPTGTDGAWQARLMTQNQLRTGAFPWPTSQSAIVVPERTAATTSYMLSCPVCPLELYGVERDSKLLGYFVLAFAPAQARLVDCWMDSDEAADWCALVRLAVLQARRHREVAEVVSMCSDPLLAAAFRRSGFHERGVRPLLVRVGAGLLLPEATIRFQMLDNDASYLHNGRSQFWA